MVFINTANSYDARDYLLSEAMKDVQDDCLKSMFLCYFELLPFPEQPPHTDKLYVRCAMNGLMTIDKSSSDLSRLLGQASFVDGVPMPWVADIWGVLGIKLAVDNSGDPKLLSQFSDWVSAFLPQRLRDSRLTPYEKSLAEYILYENLGASYSPCVALYLHYKKLLPIAEGEQKNRCIENFFVEFREAYKLKNVPLILGAFVYVFDAINSEMAALPPKLWDKQDIICFLENISSGLKRWTWEDKAKTSKSQVVKWLIENEYHVQNLLYVMLAPIFPDITDERYTAPIGQKNPRLDLYIPSIDVVIEVKFRKDTKKSFQDLIGEIAEDASLYRSDPKFKGSALIIFLWDHTRATEQHSKFKEGILQLDHVDGCVIICSPSVMG